VATSTPINLIELNSSLKGDIVEDENHLITNNVIEVMNSNMSNQADILISNDVDSKLESTIKEKPYVQKSNQTVESENSLKENTERLNRSNFYLKNITTSMNYMQVFISIVTKFPLIQLNATDKSPRIKYLCVAGNCFFL
jgi:Ni,Fe-hydrogenase I large subunit